MRYQEGFAPLFVLVSILILVLVAGGAYYLGQTKIKPVPNSQPIIGNLSSLPSPTQLVPTQQPQTSIMPDETVNWKTYTNKKYGFSFNYPPNLTLSPEKEFQHGLSIDLFYNGWPAPPSSPPRMNILLDVTKEYAQQQLTDINTILSTKQLSIKGSGIYNYLLLSTNEVHGQSLYSFSEEWNNTPGALPPAGGPLSKLVALGVINGMSYNIYYLYDDPSKKEIISQDQKIFNQIISTFKFTQ